MSTILEMRNISKYFGPVVANSSVNFSVKEGEVHALLGENGAGKSTLMNILYGLYAQTEGEIFYRGEKVEIRSPGQAIKLGIGMVHQHFMLIPALTAIENVVLGYEGNAAVLDLKSAAVRFSEMAERYRMNIDPWIRVEQLSVGQQQRLEILKALFREAQLLILDEPTAVLTPQEVEGLFDIIRQLTEEGRTVIFISHKLGEIMTICDRCTVLRQGRVVAEGLSVSEIQDANELAELMVGKSVELITDKKACAIGDVVLSVNGLTAYNDRKIKALDNVSFDVRGGEILGVAGVDGNGQSELVKCLTGLMQSSSGTVTISGVDCTNKSPKEVLRRGVSHIPEDRQKMGMIASMNLRENLTLMEYDSEPFSGKGGFLHWKWITDHSEKLCTKYQVKTPGTGEIAGNLSGGNQQKLVVGRELDREPDLLIAVHPSRGLDIGATKYIQSRILEERDRGAAVLMVSTELDEIMEISDRILVIYEGEVMDIVAQSEAERNRLGLLMAGIKNGSVQARPPASAE
jgi:ABC-type uncharacterized transport system ATPase subunit